MPNFANAKIYKLINSIDDKIYVGSTCKTLKNRFNDHRATAKVKPDRCIYRHFNNIGLMHVSIVLIEYYPCNNKFELLQRERYYVEQLKPQLNYNIPTRTNKQYKIDNAETIKQYEKQYCIDNADILNHRAKQYYIDNKEHVKQYKIDNAETYRQYRIDHVEHIKQYRIDNKEHANQQQKIRRQQQKNIKFIQHMADLIASHQPKHYYLQKFDIFSALH